MALGILPKLSNINSKDKFVTNPIAIEDVLGRKQKVHNPELLKDILNKVVIVTGAGGSIGSEICRQVSLLKPKKIILIEENEFALYKALQNLKGNILPILADIRDFEKINTIIKDYKPDIVFHAAALKHITFVEEDPMEALKTNFLATYKLCKICKSHNIPKFIFISTDKAVNPSNIMGASKRLCEKYIQNYSLSSNTTKFLIVRFGNVLGQLDPLFLFFRNKLNKVGLLQLPTQKLPGIL